MRKLTLAVFMLAAAGLVHADGLKLNIKPPPGLPGPEVKIKVGDDDARIKAEKDKHGNRGKHKGYEKGKGNKH